MRACSSEKSRWKRQRRSAASASSGGNGPGRRQASVQRHAGRALGEQQVGRSAGQVAEQRVDLVLPALRSLAPVLDDLEIAQQDVHLRAAESEPGAAVHESAPASGRMDGAKAGERARVELAAIVEREIPVARRIGAAQCARSAERDRDGAACAGDRFDEDRDLLRELGRRSQDGPPTCGSGAAESAPSP